jgi:hypothetical protein
MVALIVAVYTLRPTSTQMVAERRRKFLLFATPGNVVSGD